MPIKKNGLFAAATATAALLSFAVYTATTTNAQPPVGSGGRMPRDARDDHSGHDHSGHDHSGHDHSGHDHSGHDHSGHDHSNETTPEPSRADADAVDAPAGGPPPLPTSNSIEQSPSGPGPEDTRPPMSPRRPIPNAEQFSQPSHLNGVGNCPLANGRCSHESTIDTHSGHIHGSAQDVGHSICPLYGNPHLTRTPFRDVGTSTNLRPHEMGRSGHYRYSHDMAPMYNGHIHRHDCPLDFQRQHSEYYGHGH